MNTTTTQNLEVVGVRAAFWAETVHCERVTVERTAAEIAGSREDPFDLARYLSSGYDDGAGDYSTDTGGGTMVRDAGTGQPAACYAGGREVSSSRAPFVDVVPSPAIAIADLTTKDGAPMFDEATREYLRHVAVVMPSVLEPFAATHCPECGQQVTGAAGAAYVTVDDGAWGHVVIGESVVLGCEGFFVVDPAVVGVPRGNWEDWREPGHGLHMVPATPAPASRAAVMTEPDVEAVLAAARRVVHEHGDWAACQNLTLGELRDTAGQPPLTGAGMTAEVVTAIMNAVGHVVSVHDYWAESRDLTLAGVCSSNQDALIDDLFECHPSDKPHLPGMVAHVRTYDLLLGTSRASEIPADILADLKG